MKTKIKRKVRVSYKELSEQYEDELQELRNRLDAAADDRRAFLHRLAIMLHDALDVIHRNVKADGHSFDSRPLSKQLEHAFAAYGMKLSDPITESPDA